MARPRKSLKPQADRSLAIGYLRCSTEEQAVSGLGLAAQEEAISREAERRGCRVVAIFSDPAVSGSIPPERRAGLSKALESLAAGEAGLLIVAKLDRLSRSTIDTYALLDRSSREGWGLATTNGTLDTSTPMGRAMAGMASVFAQLERELTGERTRDALAVKRASGVMLGNPNVMADDAATRILVLRAQGKTMAAIAERMCAEGYRTARGGAWRPSTVYGVIRRAEEACPLGAE